MTQHTAPRYKSGMDNNQDEPRPGALSGDILYGAKEIAEFLGGTAERRRTIYNLVQQGRIPHFRLGAIICARKSALLEWIAIQERAK